MWQDLPDGCDWQHGNFASLVETFSYGARKGGFKADPDVPFDFGPSPAAFEKKLASLGES